MGACVQQKLLKAVIDYLCLQVQELSQGYSALPGASWQEGDLEDVSKLSTVTLWICVQLGSQHRPRQQDWEVGAIQVIVSPLVHLRDKVTDEAGC